MLSQPYVLFDKKRKQIPVDRDQDNKLKLKERVNTKGISESEKPPQLLNVGGTIIIKSTPEEIAGFQIEASKVTAIQKLDNLLKKTETVLMRIQNIFPFVLFPTTIIIDLNKIDIIYKSFFFSERRHIIEIKDIADVFVDTSLFFASLKLLEKNSLEKMIVIPYLKKEEAMKAHVIIQGLVTAQREQVDLLAIKDDHIVEKIEELGSPNI